MKAACADILFVLAAVVIALSSCASESTKADPDGDLDAFVDGDSSMGDYDTSGSDCEAEDEEDSPAHFIEIAMEAVTISSSMIEFRWSAGDDFSFSSLRFGSEPPANLEDPLPDPSKAIDVIGESDRAVIEGLASSVNVFIRIEGMSEGLPAIGFLHLRTLGGPRALLDTPLREVHAMSPRILAFVLDNGDGETWVAGDWKLHRSDGAVLPVLKTHRRSIPVGAPDYQVGYGLPYSDDVIDVDHWIFLELAEEIGSNEIIEIDGPEALSFILPYSDRYLETPVIQLNQVSYSPISTRRYAYVYGHLGDGGPLSLAEFPENAQLLEEPDDSRYPRTAVVDLTISSRMDFDEQAGGEVRQIDLAAMTEKHCARYRVRLPGIGVSFPTRISEQGYFKAFFTATRGLFHNRWGGDLRPDLTDWSRPPDHPTVYTAEQLDFTRMYDENTPKQGERVLAGGYHDAGDFDQRPMHTIVAMTLLSACELDLERFGDGQLDIPESENGIPDLLDEALWGVEGWAQLQNEEGGVRLGVESHRHPYGFYLANEDPLPYWTYAVHKNITARVAGLFAQAAYLLGPFDSLRAATYEERALSAYVFAKGKGAADAYMLYAAGELWRLTGREKYKDEFERAWYSLGAYGPFHRIALDYQVTPNAYYSAFDDPSQAYAKADYLMAYLSQPDADETIVQTAKDFLRTGALTLIERTKQEHAHRNPRRSDMPLAWGKAAMMGTYIEAAMAVLRLGWFPELRQDLIDAVSLCADYMLGGNPLGTSFYTGLGSRRPMEPLHLDSLVFIKQGKGPVPGIPVFGPVDGPLEHVWSKPTLEKLYPPMEQLPPSLRYADVRTLVFCNESTVWGDYAPNIKLFSMLMPIGMIPPDSWLAGEEEHKNPLP